MPEATQCKSLHADADKLRSDLVARTQGIRKYKYTSKRLCWLQRLAGGSAIEELQLQPVAACHRGPTGRDHRRE